MGFLGRRSQPLPHRLGIWGSAVSSPSGRQAVSTTFEVRRKTFPDTSVVLLVLKTGSHRNALDYYQIAYLRPVPLPLSIQHFTRLNCAPFSIDFARVTCVKLRFVTHNEFDFTRLKQVAQLWQRDSASSGVVTLRLNFRWKGYVSR